MWKGVAIIVLMGVWIALVIVCLDVLRTEYKNSKEGSNPDERLWIGDTCIELNHRSTVEFFFATTWTLGALVSR